MARDWSGCYGRKYGEFRRPRLSDSCRELLSQYHARSGRWHWWLFDVQRQQLLWSLGREHSSCSSDKSYGRCSLIRFMRRQKSSPVHKGRGGRPRSMSASQILVMTRNCIVLRTLEQPSRSARPNSQSIAQYLQKTGEYIQRERGCY